MLWTAFVVVAAASALLLEDQSLIDGLMMNLSFNLCLIASWHMAVVIYAGRQDRRRLAEVFA